jgi:hypothetical protein
MRDKGIDYEVSRFVTDDEDDSPMVMWAIALGAPLFLIGCIAAAHWMWLA